MYVTIAILLVIIALLWKLASYNHGYFTKMGIPGPPPLPFFGNLLYIGKRGFYGLDLEWKQKYGKLHGHFMGSCPVLVVHDEELIKQICVKEAHCFTDRLTLGLEGYPLNKGVNILKGGEWKRVRNLLTPNFTTGKLKKMTPLIQTCAEILQRRFAQAAESGEEVEMKAYYSSYTMDVIASTLFGIKSGAQEDPNDEFNQKSKLFLKFSFLNPFILLIFFAPKFVKIVNYFKPKGFIRAELVDYFMQSISQALSARKASPHEYHDFLALMLKARSNAEDLDQKMPEQAELDGKEEATTEEEDNKWKLPSAVNPKGLSEHEMLAQSMIFMIAGFETTASALNFCSYFLAKHPEYQDRCRQEIRDVLGSEMPNYENVGKLTFLDLCLQETLRICPPALRFDRMTTQDVTLKDSEGRSIFIPKGLDIGIPLHALHCDPELWDRPEEFIPDRLEGEELDRRRRNFHFIPFGIGPRNCIGMRLALLEIKIALACVLSKVKLVVCDKTLDKLEFSPVGLLNTKVPIVLRAEKVC